MSQIYFTMLTPHGESALLNALNGGETIKLSHMAAGDGGGAEYTPTEGQAALLNEVFQTELSDIYIDADNPSWLVCEAYIPADIGGFWIREIAVKDENQETFAVGSYPARYKPVLSDGSAGTALIKFVLKITNEKQIELSVDNSTLFVNQGQLIRLKNRVNSLETTLTDTGETAGSAVQSATLGGAAVAKSGTQLQFPALATAAQGAKADTALQPADMTAHNTSNSAHNDIRQTFLSFLDGLPSYNSATHIITFTRGDGATLNIDLPLEGLAQGLSYDAVTKELVLTAQNGSQIRVSVADLIDVYAGSAGSQIQVTVDSGNIIKATLLNGSIEEAKLATALANKINAKAEQSDLTAHVNSTSNPHSVNKSQLGLGSVADILQYSANNLPPQLALRSITPDIHDWIPYGASGMFAGEGAGIVNTPGADWYRYIGISHSNAAGYITLLAMPLNEHNRFFIKTCISGSWSGWKEFADANDSRLSDARPASDVPAWAKESDPPAQPTQLPMEARQTNGASYGQAYRPIAEYDAKGDGFFYITTQDQGDPVNYRDKYSIAKAYNAVRAESAASADNATVQSLFPNGNSNPGYVAAFDGGYSNAGYTALAELRAALGAVTASDIDTYVFRVNGA